MSSSLRVILIGSTEVGKSSLLLQFAERTFQKEHEMTLGVEMSSRTLFLDAKEVKVDIWDTAGQESYLSITRSYYRGADGCLLVYDSTKRASFDALPMWLNEARQNANNPNLIVLLIGNKNDLIEEREVSKEEGQSFAEEHGLIFFEVNAKSHNDVEEIFVRAALEITRRISEFGRIRVPQGSGLGVKLRLRDKESESKSGDCCGGSTF